jgi:4'-phosphopantetheinyl transferase
MTAAAHVAPPAALELSPADVHVWQLALDVDPPTLAALERTLSADERARADRFHFRRDRDRFVAARGTLRTLVARYLGLGPAELRFAYGPQGKPRLAGDDDAELRFNLAHSEGVALLAVTRGRAVGVDVERVRPERATRDVAERFFARAEVTALRAYPPDEWAAAFFACWSRKEAYVKARGEGLSFPLDAFEVSVRPGERAVALRVPGDPAEARRWSLRELRVGPDHAAAIAVEGDGWQLTQRITRT